MGTLFSGSGVEVVSIELGEKEFIGIKVSLKGAPLLLVKGKRILVGCGYFNSEILEKMGNAACIVTGVRDFDDVLSAEVKTLTSNAMEVGAKPGMKVKDVLALD